MGGLRRNVRVRAEAANNVAYMRAFEVEYYPRVGTPEFVVKATRVHTAISSHWTERLKFKMQVEDEVFGSHARIEDAYVVSSRKPIDSQHFLDSIWRSLEVSKHIFYI